MAAAATTTNNFLQIPARNDLPWYQFKLTLDSVVYTFHLRYNIRSQRWIMDINDSSDNPILNGVPVLIQRNLTGQYATLTLPKGVFFSTDDTNQDTQPMQFSFGVDHSLWYSDPA